MAQPRTAPVTILSGATKSGATNLGDMPLVALLTPAAFTGAAVTFEVSIDGVAYVALYDGSAAYSVSVGVDRAVPLNAALFQQWAWVKVVSGSAEGADRIVTLVKHPLPLAGARGSGSGSGGTVVTGSVTATLTAGELHLGAVAGESVVVSSTPTVSTSPAYTANDNVGGKLTLANAVRVAGGVSILQSVQVLDRSNQKMALSILIFDADPSGTTWTDNASPTIAAADISMCIRRIEIGAADYVTTDHAGTDFATAEITALAKLVKSAATTSLWAAILTTGTPTYATTTALTLRFGFLYAN